MGLYPHVSAMVTEGHSALVAMKTFVLDGECAAIPVDAGEYPEVTVTGRVDYGQPVPRATWRRNLPLPTPLTCKVCKPPYKHYSAQVHG